MSSYRCPDPSHEGSVVPLKANNDRVYECPGLHKFWRREESGAVLLVNLITQEKHRAEEIAAEEGAPERPRLNFMVDVPQTKGGLDFNALSLSPPQWKVISRIDGRSTLEEVRLLAGLTPQEAETIVYELVDAGLVEVRRRGGR